MSDAELLDKIRQIVTIPEARYWVRLEAIHALLGTTPPPKSECDPDVSRRAHEQVEAIVGTEARRMTEVRAVLRPRTPGTATTCVLGRPRHEWMIGKDRRVRACSVCGQIKGREDVRVDLSATGWLIHLPEALRLHDSEVVR